MRLVQGRHAIRRFGLGIVLASLLLSLLSAGQAVAASATTRWVAPDGHAGGSRACNGAKVAFTSIQAAVDASSASDSVRVCPGKYRETVTISVANLSVAGVTGLKARIIPPQNDTSSAGFSEAAVLVTANHVTLRNLNVVIHGGCEFVYTGILVSVARHVRVLHSRTASTGSEATGCGLDDGIVYDRSTGEVANSQVSAFRAIGIYAYNGADVAVHDNAVTMYASTCVTAVCASGGQYPTGISVFLASAAVNHNTITADSAIGSVASVTAGVAVGESRVSEGHAVTVTQNTIRGASVGVSVSTSSGTVAWNDIRAGASHGLIISASNDLKIRHNRVKNQGGDGIDVKGDSLSNTIRDNNFSGNAGVDCVDESTGPANTWTDNVGAESSPSGICTPAAP